MAQGIYTAWTRMQQLLSSYLQCRRLNAHSSDSYSSRRSLTSIVSPIDTCPFDTEDENSCTIPAPGTSILSRDYSSLGGRWDASVWRARPWPSYPVVSGGFWDHLQTAISTRNILYTLSMILCQELLHCLKTYKFPTPPCRKGPETTLSGTIESRSIHLKHKQIYFSNYVCKGVPLDNEGVIENSFPITSCSLQI